MQGYLCNLYNSVLWRNVALFTDVFVIEFYNGLYKVLEIMKCVFYGKDLPTCDLMMVQIPRNEFLEAFKNLLNKLAGRWLRHHLESG